MGSIYARRYVNKKRWAVVHSFSSNPGNTIKCSYLDSMLFHGENLYPNPSQWKIPENDRPLFLRRNIGYIPLVSLPTTSNFVVHKTILESILAHGFRLDVKPAWITKPIHVDFAPTNTQWTYRFNNDPDDQSDAWQGFPTVHQTTACKKAYFAVEGGKIRDPRLESFAGMATARAALRDAIVKGTEQMLVVPVNELEHHDLLTVDCYAMLSWPLYELLKSHLYPRFFRVCELEFA